MSNFKGYWKKQGLIITPQKNLWWMKTHAMLPTVDQIKGSLFRIYFSGRDKNNISYIGHAVIDIELPFRVLEYSPEPDLYPGELGCFDDNGVTPSWIVNFKGKKYLYYIGWNRRSRVRMSLTAGLAISEDGGLTFKRYSKAPLMERTDSEPYSILTAPCVLTEKGVWKTWYVSGVGWINEDLPKYNIKYATSDDGIHWRREGIVCIDFKSDKEIALARPCIVYDNGRYRMWYSHKGENYRIGYAQSKDGITWERKDDLVGIDVSPSGWDSEMIEYSYVISHKGKKYMFYNGNNYGRDGIGHAICD